MHCSRRLMKWSIELWFCFVSFNKKKKKKKERRRELVIDTVRWEDGGITTTTTTTSSMDGAVWVSQVKCSNEQSERVGREKSGQTGRLSYQFTISRSITAGRPTKMADSLLVLGNGPARNTNSTLCFTSLILESKRVGKNQSTPFSKRKEKCAGQTRPDTTRHDRRLS